MTFEELLNAWPPARIAWRQGDLRVAVGSIAYDSRRVEKGALFVAVPGEKVDGHHFIAAALEQGAVGILAHDQSRIPSGVPAVGLADVRWGLAQVARAFFKNPSGEICIVGITGTNGKTTTSYLLEHLLRTLGRHVGVTGTVNYRYGSVEKPSAMTTPESLDYQSMLAEMKRAGVDTVVSEISSHGLAMSRAEGVDFDVAAFTNLTRDHLDFHASLDAYFTAKARLFTEHLAHSPKKNATAVINIDDEYGRRLLGLLKKSKVITYSVRDTSATLYARHVHFTATGISADLCTGTEQATLNSNLLGKHNLSNLLCALAIAKALGFELTKAVSALGGFDSVPGRLQAIANRSGKTVLVDYAHTPDALENVLSALRALVVAPSRLFCVFGCGGDRDPGKRPLMGQIAARLCDGFIVTSDNPRTEDPRKIIDDIQQGIPEEANYDIVVDRQSAIEKAIARMKSGDVLLIAGKGHENYQIVGQNKLPFDDRHIARTILEGEVH